MLYLSLLNLATSSCDSYVHCLTYLSILHLSIWYCIILNDDMCIYVNLSNCHHLINGTLCCWWSMPNILTICQPINIFTKWTVYCWWSLPYNLSICQPVDLSPSLHSRKCVSYEFRHIYVTCRPAAIFTNWSLYCQCSLPYNSYMSTIFWIWTYISIQPRCMNAIIISEDREMQQVGLGLDY